MFAGHAAACPGRAHLACGRLGRPLVPHRAGDPTPDLAPGRGADAPSGPPLRRPRMDHPPRPGRCRTEPLPATSDGDRHRHLRDRRDRRFPRSCRRKHHHPLYAAFSLSPRWWRGWYCGYPFWAACRESRDCGRWCVSATWRRRRSCRPSSLSSSSSSPHPLYAVFAGSKAAIGPAATQRPADRRVRLEVDHVDRPPDGGRVRPGQVTNVRRGGQPGRASGVGRCPAPVRAGRAQVLTRERRQPGYSRTSRDTARRVRAPPWWVRTEPTTSDTRRFGGDGPERDSPEA